MTVFEKLNLARCKVQEAKIKKQGKNAFAGYSYFELEDILPVANGVCAEVKATIAVSFDREMARLWFIDAEKPDDRVEFTLPMSEAKLKGCHEVQNLGAVQTYLKRYLYQNCLEIAEGDALDCGRAEEKPQQQGGKHTRKECVELAFRFRELADAGYADKGKASQMEVFLNGQGVDYEAAYGRISELVRKGEEKRKEIEGGQGAFKDDSEELYK